MSKPKLDLSKCAVHKNFYWDDVHVSVYVGERGLKHIRDVWAEGDKTTKEYKQQVKASRVQYDRVGCWGFARPWKGELHIVMKPDCEQDELMAILVHEMAHCLRPRHREYELDEAKACLFEGVAWWAAKKARKIKRKLSRAKADE